jgi:FtsP/CotA-like multicopper oxidase with cupredoxin domain
MNLSRRQFISYSGAGGAGVVVFGSRMLGLLGGPAASAVPAAVGLSDPALQPKFANPVPNALDPGFRYAKDRQGRYKVQVRTGLHDAGLVNASGSPIMTPIYGYSDQASRLPATWPGRTFEVQRSADPVRVIWNNGLKDGPEHLLPVDESLHWCYSLKGYGGKSITKDGVPIITHVHGGHTDWQFDGNPEFFYNWNDKVVGPQWDDVPGGFTKQFSYDVDVPAAPIWYHDHALGLTRLNVYAGMAGFFIVRDESDTGQPDNPLDLPAFPYEAAFAIQDRMFAETGELFYPAFPGDPFYDDFITGEGAILPPKEFPGGGPTALAEFFGDHMVVNGKIWPKFDVEPRKYRIRLLNGCDSRFLVVRFRVAASPTATDLTDAGAPVPFTVIGGDQGLASSPTQIDTLVMETGSRYDVIFDFENVPSGGRVIMENIGGDAPFGGDFGDDLDSDDLFPNRQTDRIMAFDVVLPLDPEVPDVNPAGIAFGPVVPTPTRLRKVALFEGMDEYGRLQPLLGTAEPATDYLGNPVLWPDEPRFKRAGLVGQIEGSIAWHSPTTENPALGDTEEWEIWNMTGDAHPVHLHLVNFEVIGRREINFDSSADDDGFIPDDASPADDGVFLVTQAVVQHNGNLGHGFRIVHPTNPEHGYGAEVPQPIGYVENAPKDMVTALPGQVTRIKATFDKPGRYVWHCHILSHEDHEMMRTLHVGPGA